MRGRRKRASMAAFDRCARRYGSVGYLGIVRATRPQMLTAAGKGRPPAAGAPWQSAIARCIARPGASRRTGHRTGRDGTLAPCPPRVPSLLRRLWTGLSTPSFSPSTASSSTSPVSPPPSAARNPHPWSQPTAAASGNWIRYKTLCPIHRNGWVIRASREPLFPALH